MADVISGLATDLRDLAILLDVDGTILELAATPLDVQVPVLLLRTLARLYERTGGAIAFVSGRPIGDLDAIFAPLKLPAIGGHGAEIRPTADAGAARQRVAPLNVSVKNMFAALAELDPGIIVEDKGYSLALHYRLAPDKETVIWDRVAQIRAALPTTSLELLRGKAMVEIKQTRINKASAIRELMTVSPFAGRQPLFLGDDVTDRDALGMMRELRGVAISVGERLPGVDHCFDRPADVRRWLEQLSHSGAFAIPAAHVEGEERRIGT